MLLAVTISEASTISSSTLIGLAVGFLFSTIGIFIQNYFLERREKKKERQKIREESVLVMSKTFTRISRPNKMYVEFHPFLTLNINKYIKDIRNPLFSIFHKLPEDISKKAYALDYKVNYYEQKVMEVSADLKNDGYLNDLELQEVYIYSIGNEENHRFPSENPDIRNIMDLSVLDDLKGKYFSGLINEEENTREIRRLEQELKNALESEIDKYRMEIYN